VEVINLDDNAHFSDQFSPQILRMALNYKIPFICMKAGQEIPSHPSGSGVFYIVSGKAVMSVKDEKVNVKAGDMIFVEKGDERGIRATETLMAFAVHVNS